MTPPSRGDVVLVRYPTVDLTGYKLRPALVVQADGLPTGYDDRMVAMITSRLDRTGPTCIAVRRESGLGRSMGLRTDSVIGLHRIATPPLNAFDRVIGQCRTMDPADNALRAAFGLT